MPKQDGIIKVKGTLENITFYKTQDGYLMRRKTNLTDSQVKNNNSFLRTRENGSEFGNAGKAGKTLRMAFNSISQLSKDNRVVSRLVQQMMKVIHTDTTSVRGQRNVMNGQTSLLEGFDFNINAKLDGIMKAPFLATIDRAAGSLTVSIPSFVPANSLVAPQGATHFKVLSAGAEINFAADLSTVQVQESPIIPLNAAATPVLNLGNNVTPASTLPLFATLAIHFYQQVNGLYYPLSASNPLAIVKTA